MNKHQQSGVTLVEVLVTLVIMSVGLLGLAGLQTTAIKDSLAIAQRSQVVWLVTELVERMRANPDALYDKDAYAGSIETDQCDSAPLSCSDTNSSTNANACTAIQIAAFDRWEIFCGQPAPANDVISNSVDSLNLNSITIACIDGNCNDGNDSYQVDISWTSTVVSSGSTLAADTINDRQTRRISMTVRP